ncbi:radical SAM protein [uncultured Brachyspira sp.]|uniref:SPL family radical SAM protein n=1 Tax=uncultured Brachyspira sp. TaxID=221953 RepID=UPI0025E3664B|nr:radical SAM protein [uncultured Brachyspira sp.]
MIKYREINCKSALNRVNNEYGFCYDLNIYRGCMHKCYYCFAVYSHKYINSKDFFGEIFVKKNIAEVLEKELSSKNWSRDIINLGSVTDNYQEAERDYKLMRDILKLLIKYKTPMNISTKSDLILRDFDLIDELSRISSVRIAVTITSLDEKLSSITEPNAVSPLRRFNILREFKKTKAITAVHTMPVMPFITEDKLEDIFKKVKEYNIDCCICDVLKLKGECRKIYLNFIRENFCVYYKKYLYIYGSDGLLKDEYRKKLSSKIKALEEKYNISCKTENIFNTKNIGKIEEPSLF